MATRDDNTDVGRAWLRSLGYDNIDNPMSDRIAEWRAWYEATADYYDSEDTEKTQSGTDTFRVQRISIHPAEMVCEGWADVLANEDAIAVSVGTEDDGELYADAADVLDGWISDTDFIEDAHEVVADEMWSGTAGWALRIDDMPIDGSTSDDVRIVPCHYDARHIIPLTFDGGTCTEAAFISGTTIMGKRYTQMSVHRVSPTTGGREILTAFFNEGGSMVTLDGYAGSVELGTESATFALIRPAIKNTYWPHSPFGVSVFDRAIGAVVLTDDAIDNMHRDIYLGQKMVMLPENMIRRDADGNRTIPRAKDQQLFVQTAEGSLANDKGGIDEWNPDLRMTDNRLALRTALEMLGERCGLGKDFFSLDESGNVAKTAKEVASSEKALLRNAEKHGHAVKKAMEAICESALEIVGRLQGMALPDCTGKVRVELADAIITDDETKRETDLKDVSVGALPLWVYIMRWQGVDEATAKEWAGVQEQPTPAGPEV